MKLPASPLPLLAFTLSLLTLTAAAQSTPRQVIDLDPQWRFLQSDATHAEAPTFDDASWHQVDLPHDWSIAGPVAKENPTGQGGGYFPNGLGWYRKSFSLPTTAAKSRIYVVFDGVMANSDVWINGTPLGHRPNGTVSFFYDLTGHLNLGPNAKNILAVRCDNAQQPASRWYEGAGIYRPVRLVLTSPVHIAPWGTVVTTPQVSADSATLHIRTTVQNDSNAPATVSATVAIELPTGKPILTDKPITSAPVTIPAHSHQDLNLALTIPHPDRWDIAHPALHIAHLTIGSDNEDVPFGIREFHFDPDTGFWLNGRNFKLKGAALHIDGGAVGIAVPDAVYEHRLRSLQALGVNAIRTAHNPPSPAFLDLCDRLGLLVMDEMFDAWTVGKNPYDYHLYFRDWALRDTADTVQRDRNHPSIILWSAGNEIHDTPHPEVAIPILKSLVATFHQYDPTRPVTQALFRPNASHDYDNGLADLLDVVGQNYRERELLAAHAAKPTRKIVGTENGPDREIWLALRDNPPYSGQFLWTGADYLGEAGEAGGWPITTNGSGLLDRTGSPRPRAFERQSWWSTQPNVHIVRRVGATEKLNIDPGYENVPARFKQVLFADWNPINPQPHTETVEVYTNADEVELQLNGTSLGRQQLHPDASPLIWRVPYAPGTLRAIAYQSGHPVATDQLRTATQPTQILLHAEKPTLTNAPTDLVYLTATVADASGTPVPDSSTLIHFTLTGPGQILATDSGNNADHAPFNLPQRHAFQGHAVVLVRATAPTGTITVTATAEALTPASATLTATPTPKPRTTRSF